MARKSTKKGFLIGAVFGSIVAGISALLLAPKSGKKLRRDIADKYEDTKEKAEELADKAKNIAKDAKKTAKSIFKK